MILDRLPGGDIREAVTEPIAQLTEFAGLGGVDLTTGHLDPHHEIAAFLGLLAVNSIPLHPVEVGVLNGGEPGLCVAVNVVNDVQSVLLELQFFLRRDGNESLFNCGKVGLDINHGGKKARKSMGKVVNCNAKALPKTCPGELSPKPRPASVASWKKETLGFMEPGEVRSRAPQRGGCSKNRVRQAVPASSGNPRRDCPLQGAGV